MGFWTLIIIAFVIGCILAIGKAINISKKQEKMTKRLSTLTDFNINQEVMGSDGKTGIAIDEERKKVCLIECMGNMEVALAQANYKDKQIDPTNTRFFSYKDILSCQISEDNIEVTKTSRTSQIGSALLDELALDGSGVIKGALSGKTVTGNKVSRVDLRLIVNDTSNPTHIVNFLNIKSKKGGTLYNQAMEKVGRWYALMEVLIRQADVEDKKNEDQSAVTGHAPDYQNAFSVADELKKLEELHSTEVLTDEEFQVKKKKLLYSEATDKLSAEDWFRKGWKLYNSGNYKEAINAYTDAVNISPRYVLAYFHRAAAYHRLGNQKQTVNDLKTSAKLGHKKAQDLLKLKNIDW